MKVKAQASFEFLLVFVFFVSILSLCLACLNYFNFNVFSLLAFFKAKSNALECGFCIDSLSANSALKILKPFACFSDSNYSVASVVEGSKASFVIISKASIVQTGSGISLEVESNEHYK